MTAALEGGWVVRSTPRPHFTPGKDPVPVAQEAGWAPGPVWTDGKSRPHRDSIPGQFSPYSAANRLSYRAHPKSVINKNNISVDKKNQLDVTFSIFISLLIVAQHVSGNHLPIIRSWRLRDVIALCWYVLWLQEGGQDRLAGSASMDALPVNRSIVIYILFNPLNKTNLLSFVEWIK